MPVLSPVRRRSSLAPMLGVTGPVPAKGEGSRRTSRGTSGDRWAEPAAGTDGPPPPTGTSPGVGAAEGGDGDRVRAMLEAAFRRGEATLWDGRFEIFDALALEGVRSQALRPIELPVLTAHAIFLARTLVRSIETTPPGEQVGRLSAALKSISQLGSQIGTLAEAVRQRTADQEGAEPLERFGEGRLHGSGAQSIRSRLLTYSDAHNAQLSVQLPLVLESREGRQGLDFKERAQLRALVQLHLRQLSWRSCEVAEAARLAGEALDQLPWGSATPSQLAERILHEVLDPLERSSVAAEPKRLFTQPEAADAVRVAWSDVHRIAAQRTWVEESGQELEGPSADTLVGVTAEALDLIGAEYQLIPLPDSEETLPELGIRVTVLPGETGVLLLKILNEAGLDLWMDPRFPGAEAYFDASMQAIALSGAQLHELMTGGKERVREGLAHVSEELLYRRVVDRSRSEAGDLYAGNFEHRHPGVGQRSLTTVAFAALKVERLAQSALRSWSLHGQYPGVELAKLDRAIDLALRNLADLETLFRGALDAFADPLRELSFEEHGVREAGQRPDSSAWMVLRFMGEQGRVREIELGLEDLDRTRDPALLRGLMRLHLQALWEDAVFQRETMTESQLSIQVGRPTSVGVLRSQTEPLRALGRRTTRNLGRKIRRTTPS